MSNAFLFSSHYSEWRSRNVFVAPFDKNDVFALLMNDVTDGVTFLSLMFDHNFITRNFGTINAHVEDVVACLVTVHSKAILSTDQGLFETLAPCFDL